jgi:uncharacterized protein YcbX
VEELWRYLLKSARGQSLDAVHLDRHGPRGDRRWACIDADGFVVSAKQPRRWGRLLQVAAWTEAGLDETVLIRAPGAQPAVAGTPAADAQLSDWLGGAVTLTDRVPESPRIRRLFPREPGMRPSWSADAPEESTSSLVGGQRFVDFSPVHIVTLADLAALGGADVRRFRPNVVLSVDPLQPGDVVRLDGGVELRVTLPTPRCAVPGLEQPGLAASSDLLRTIGSRRSELPGRGSAACVGVYADVVRPGVARTGERAEVS